MKLQCVAIKTPATDMVTRLISRVKKFVFILIHQDMYMV